MIYEVSQHRNVDFLNKVELSVWPRKIFSNESANVVSELLLLEVWGKTGIQDRVTNG